MKSNKKSYKRKIPAIGIDPNFTIELSDILGDFSFKEMVYKETAESIKSAFHSKQDTAVLFQINNENTYFEIPKTQWKQAINTCLEQLQNKEKFEECIELKHIIDNI